MPRADIRGVMIPNDYKWFYDYFEEDSTCPRDIQTVLDSCADGERLDVYINSPGGVIDVGSEIYTILREATERLNVRMHITGQACSAASIVAMAAHCDMSPTALMMVHCVSTRTGGNHAAMERAAEMLRTADAALCTAYTNKSGMNKDAALEMMEKETWLSATQAKEYGLIDEIMFEKEEAEGILTNAVGFELPTEEMMAEARKNMKNQDGLRKREAKARLNLLALNYRSI